MTYLNRLILIGILCWQIGLHAATIACEIKQPERTQPVVGLLQMRYNESSPVKFVPCKPMTKCYEDYTYIYIGEKDQYSSNYIAITFQNEKEMVVHSHNFGVHIGGDFQNNQTTPVEGNTYFEYSNDFYQIESKTTWSMHNDNGVSYLDSFTPTTLHRKQETYIINNCVLTSPW